MDILHYCDLRNFMRRSGWSKQIYICRHYNRSNHYRPNDRRDFPPVAELLYRILAQNNDVLRPGFDFWYIVSIYKAALQKIRNSN